MLAAKLTDPPGIDLVETEVPRPGRGECLVEVRACGICASDLRFLAGHGAARPGTTLGHEATGIVVGLGEDVDRSLSDQPVAINPLIGCGACSRCVAGRPQRCPGREFVGIQRDGAFAEFVKVPAENLVSLPPDADLVSSALAEPFSVARHALGPGVAESIAVIGAGGIGLGAILVARARGTEVVLADDLSEAALGKALRCGAQPLPTDRTELVAQVIDCSGAAKALPRSTEVVSSGGEIVLVGIASDAVFPYEMFVRGELRARGAFAYEPADFEEVAPGLGSGHLDATPLAVETVPLTAINDAVEILRADPGAHSRIIVQPRP